MSVVLMVVLICIATGQSLFGKLFTLHYTGEKSVCSTVYSVWYGIVIMLIVWAINGFAFAPSMPSVLLGIVNGGILFFYNMMLLRASATGSYSLTMIFNLVGGLAVPVFVTFFQGNYTFSWLQIVALVIVVVSFFMMNTEGLKEKAQSGLFYVYCIFLFLLNGFYGVMLDWQQTLMHQTEREEFLMISFGVSGVLAFAVLLIQRRKQTLGDLTLAWKPLVFALGGSGACSIASNLMMYCMSLIPAAIVLPVANAGVLVGSVLVSVILFREKFPLIKIFGVILAIAGIAMLSF